MIKKMIVKIGTNWAFLISVLLLYLITLFINKTLFIKSLLYSKEVAIEVFFVLIAVFTLTFLANLWINNKKTKKILSGKPTLIKYIGAVLLGILSTGPIYVWYPLLSELKDKGLKNSLIAIFLYNRSVKIPLMPMIIHYFGLPFLLITTFFMIVFSLLNGFFVAKFTK